MVRQAESSLEIRPVAGPINLTIQPPGSKSITNRALLCAALATGTSTLSGVLDSDDTRVMIDCLMTLGVSLHCVPDSQTVQVVGCDGTFPNSDTSLQVENSGTTIRFLTAVLGIHGGQHSLHGTDRMHERPIGPLVEALNSLGANVVTQSPNDCPPVTIDNNRIGGGTVLVSGSVSSQYLSGLMMAAPLAASGLRIELTGELVSRPYVSMTQSVMRRFGVDSNLAIDQVPVRFEVQPDEAYRACEYMIEPDASAASYFWAAAAICGGSATVTGLNRDSLQGDVRFVECLKGMGCEVTYGDGQFTVTGPATRGIDVDMSDISDTVQTLAAVAMFVDGPTRIRGVAHNRVKETDRIGNLAIELRKLGAEVVEHSDGMTIVPAGTRPAVVETYDDHRMAMSLSLVGLRQSGVVITNPGCTAKTYPNFFEDLKLVYR